MSLRHSARVVMAASALALVAAACNEADGADAGDAAADVVRIPVTIEANTGTVAFQSEIAATPEERQRGLMFREEMGAREGMIFLFPVEQQLSFWMKNTLIPLDMIFIRADKTILGIVENATPQTEISRSVPGKSQYVLEINGGVSAELGIAAGQKVSFYVP